MDTTASNTILKLLLEKTRERKLDWVRGSSQNSYKVLLTSASFVITYLPKDEEGPDVIRLDMYNGTGSGISVSYAEINDEKYNLLRDVYMAAVDSCTKETETLENVLKELQSM